MANEPHPPPLPFPVQAGATTVGPGYVPTITFRPGLASITRAVVLTRGEGVEYAQVFRLSGDAPGLWSCDWETRKGGGPWAHDHKDENKFLPHEIPPPGAYTAMIDGMPFYTLHIPTAEEIAEHRANLCRLLDR
jgi:hypothetical protein